MRWEPGQRTFVALLRHPGRICRPSASQIRPWKGNGKQAHFESELFPRPSERAGSAKETLHFLGWQNDSAWLWQDWWSELTLESYSATLPSSPHHPFHNNHNHPMLCFARLPPTRTLIALMELVIRHRFLFDVWHCFRQCQLRWMSLVVYQFSVSTRASLTACQSWSLAADLTEALKHALVKHLSQWTLRRRDDLPLRRGTNNTELLLWIINQEAHQS